MRRTILSSLLVGAVALVGCNDANGPLGPSSASDGLTAVAGGPGVSSATELVCETMDFSEFDGSKGVGEQVTSVALFDFNVSLSVASGGAESLNEARVFDTSMQDATNDPDLQYPPVGECADCQTLGLGNVLIIQQAPGYATLVGDMVPDDSRNGGVITFSGFAGQPGTFTLEEYKAVDDDVGEPSFNAYVDGGAVSVGSSTATGNGTVETVSTGSTVFTSSFAIEYEASGAVDEIEVCRETEITEGGQGCTPGYWKNTRVHSEAWEEAGYAPGDDFCTVFGLASPGLCDTELRNPESGDLGDLTLLDALELRGGGINALTRHAVAALLNASNPGIAYDLSVADVKADYIAAIDGGDIEGQKDTFDFYNNQGCPCDNDGCPLVD